MKRKMIKAVTLTAGLALTLSSVQPAFALATSIRMPASTNLAEKIAQWGLNGDLRLFKTDFFDGVGIRAGYRYTVDPSFNNGLFTRYDRYFLNVGGTLGGADIDQVKEAGERDFGVGLGLINDVELTFARQFEEAKDAMLARPYFYKNLPFTAEKALTGLKVGDYFSMKTKLGVVVSGTFLQGLGAHFALDLNAHYLLQGSFQVHALRLPDDKLRLKLVGIRNKEKGASIGVGYEGILNIFKIERLDKQITSLLKLDPIKFEMNKGKNNLFMVDYVVDLKNESTRAAYDQVLKNATDLKEIFKSVKPNESINELKESLVMDIEPIDQLSREDLAANQAGARVSRNFRGSLDSDYKNSKLNVGIRLVRFGVEASYSEDKIVSVRDDEAKDYYRLNSYRAQTENGFFFSWLQMQRDVRMNSVMQTDANFQHPKAKDLVIRVERKDKRFRDVEFSNVKDQLNRTIPEIINNTIDFSGWQSNGKKRNNVAVRYQVVIHPEAIEAAPQLDSKQIYDRYLDYLRNIEAVDLVRAAAIRHNDGAGADLYESRLGSQVKRIAVKLAKALDKKNSGVERLEALMELRKEQLFLKTGVRFLLELLPQDLEKLKSLVRFDLDIESSDGDKVSATFGNEPESEIYKRLLSIQNLIDNDGLDLRLEGETLKIKFERNEIVR